MKWTLKELHLASERCLLADFKRLFAKYHRKTGNVGEDHWYWYAHCASFKVCNNDLLTYIMSQSQASADADGLWDIWDKMVAELLKKDTR